MDKRFQVFVSSTFKDLEDERQLIMKTLMEMNCIPAGMELFPAVDQTQFDFIKRVIDDSDYYVLVIGGRYGSLTPEGISYTEQEFDYAVEKGMKVIVFLHGDSDSITVGKTDKSENRGTLLQAFRAKAGTGRLVRFWNSASDLATLVAVNLPHTFRAYPAVGWVRSPEQNSEELLRQINGLRLENDLLKRQLIDIESAQTVFENIAGMDEYVQVQGEYRQGAGRSEQWTARYTWNEVFALISPHLLTSPRDGVVAQKLADALCRYSKDSTYTTLEDRCFQTIKIQFSSLGLTKLGIDPEKVGVPLTWSLTKKGHAMMVELRTIRSAEVDQNPTK